MEINEDTICEIIESCWANLQSRIEEGKQPLSIEKTLVFLFAVELFKKVGDNLVVDFEHQCFDHLKGENKYLDLLFYTSEDFKVAAEFKLPHDTADQKEYRKKTYRDLARLKSLSRRGEYKSCIFFMATNIRSFLNKGDYEEELDYETAHKHKISKDNSISVDNLSLNGLSCEFFWQRVKLVKNKTNDNRYYTSCGKFAWLKPIVV